MHRIMASAALAAFCSLSFAQQSDTNAADAVVYQAESTVIADSPRTVGRVPAYRRFSEPMGIYVEKVEISGSELVLSLKTDLAGPFDVIYGGAESNGLRLVRATVRGSSACVPWTNAVPDLLHVQVGLAGELSLDEDPAVTVDRARMFHYSMLIDREYYYCTKFHKYDPKGAGISYFGDSTNGLEAIVFPLQPRASVWIMQVDAGCGTKKPVSLCELSYVGEGQEDFGYGVGERIRLFPDRENDSSHQRAFSASPLRSDAKIIRLSGGGGR